MFVARWICFRRSHRRCSIKKLQLYEKRDSDTGVFLRILRNFEERFFYSKSTVIMRLVRLPVSLNEHLCTTKSCYQEMFYKKGVLKNFAKFTGKHLCQSLFFMKGTPAQLLPSEFHEIFKNIFLWTTSGPLLLTQDFSKTFAYSVNWDLHTYFAKIKKKDIYFRKPTEDGNPQSILQNWILMI